MPEEGADRLNLDSHDFLDFHDEKRWPESYPDTPIFWHNDLSMSERHNYP